MNATKTTNWVKSEAAGYAAGKLLLDAPGGGHYSVYRHGRKWVCAYVADSICRHHTTHTTRKDAMAHAEECCG